MSILDRIFGKDDEPFEVQGLIHAPLDDEFIKKHSSIKVCLNDDEEIIEVSINDVENAPSKGIDSKHWDALTSEAQKVLKDQGFYPIIKI